MRKPKAATCEETAIVTEVGRKGEREIERGLRTPPSCFSCPEQASEEIISGGSSPSHRLTATHWKTPRKQGLSPDRGMRLGHHESCISSSLLYLLFFWKYYQVNQICTGYGDT